jgi:hypothetical protein
LIQKIRIDIIKLEKTCRELEETGLNGGPKTKIIAIVGIAGTN